MSDTKSFSITSLIAVPASITLGVTVLRLAGELQHWPKPWFSPAAGGGAAIVGISWLPIVFGPYFALKLAGSGDAPSSAGKAIGFAILSLAVCFAALVAAAMTFAHPSVLTLILLLVTLGAALIPRIPWPSLGNVLVAYAFAARIPVLIVMLLAMKGNGGAGWGTHYDAVAPTFVHASFAQKYLYEAFVPQMTMWIGWTVGVGALFGAVVIAVLHPGKRAAQAVAH